MALESKEPRAGESLASFDSLVREHAAAIRMHIRMRLRDASRADDLAQEAFLVAYRRLGSFEAARPFYPWLRGIADNLIRNERRRQGTGSLDQGLDELLWKESDARNATADVEALHDCLDSLARGATRMIQSRYHEGRSIEEVAAEEGKSPNAVSVALLRIRQTLRECIERRRREEMR